MGSVLTAEETDGDQPPFILKKLQVAEVAIYKKLHSEEGDPIRKFIPSFLGQAQVEVSSPSSASSPSDLREEDPCGLSRVRYIRLSNVLVGFDQPMVMDIKMGTRSFAEDECKSNKPRADLFERMLEIKPSEPTEEEKAQGYITKFRWMTWRDRTSSSVTLGFRIDGVAGFPNQRLQHGDFVYVCRREHVIREFLDFLPPAHFRSTEQRAERRKEDCQVSPQELADVPTEVLRTKLRLALQTSERLRQFKAACEQSDFFRSHELVGASLLLVAEANPCKADVFLIDFAKTQVLPQGVRVDHRSPWVVGNHEDGFLFGLDTCISCWDEVVNILQQEAERRAMHVSTLTD